MTLSTYLVFFGCQSAHLWMASAKTAISINKLSWYYSLVAGTWFANSIILPDGMVLRKIMVSVTDQSPNMNSGLNLLFICLFIWQNIYHWIYSLIVVNFATSKPLTGQIQRSCYIWKCSFPLLLSSILDPEKPKQRPWLNYSLSMTSLWLS